jgi:hypothetical protein
MQRANAQRLGAGRPSQIAVAYGQGRMQHFGPAVAALRRT